jgi:hypothetical protein
MNELTHYASQYYDPVKAHEYYEQHKKLKGRTSTKGFSQDQKITAQYVKKQLTEERRAKTEQSKEKTKSDIKNHTRQMQSEIASLRIMLDSGALADDPEKRYEFRSKIEALRAANDKKRNELLAEHEKYSDSLKEEYDKKYEDELSKIRESSPKKESKSSSKSSKISKKVFDDDDEPTPYVAPVKSQTSVWARERERRRKEAAEKKKSVHHSELFFEEIEDIYGLTEMGEVIKSNQEIRHQFEDLEWLAHSLLDNN